MNLKSKPSTEQRTATLEKNVAKGVKQLQSQGREVAVIGGQGRIGRKAIRQSLAQTKEPVRPPQPVKVAPIFGMIFQNFLAGLSQAGAKNPSSVHSRIPGHRSKKFKGFDRENRRYSSFKKKIR
jgi:hypothetical protein